MAPSYCTPEIGMPAFISKKGHFYEFSLQKSEKLSRNFYKIREKSVNLEIEYLTKYNSFFCEIFSIGSRF